MYKNQGATREEIGRLVSITHYHFLLLQLQQSLVVIVELLIRRNNCLMSRTHLACLQPPIPAWVKYPERVNELLLRSRVLQGHTGCGACCLKDKLYRCQTPIPILFGPKIEPTNNSLEFTSCTWSRCRCCMKHLFGITFTKFVPGPLPKGAHQDTSLPVCGAPSGW